MQSSKFHANSQGLPAREAIYLLLLHWKTRHPPALAEVLDEIEKLRESIPHLPPSDPPGAVTAPDYYRHGSLECWDVVSGLPTPYGLAVKYLFRFHRAGKANADLDKAAVCVRRIQSRGVDMGLTHKLTPAQHEYLSETLSKAACELSFVHDDIEAYTYPNQGWKGLPPFALPPRVLEQLEFAMEFVNDAFYFFEPTLAGKPKARTRLMKIKALVRDAVRRMFAAAGDFTNVAIRRVRPKKGK
jgi:hypothetical protein